MRHRIHSLQGIPDGKYREARRVRREMTDSERILWTRIRRNKIDGLHFRRQHVIRGFIVDFYCRKAKRVVEVDGEIHRNQFEQDRIRDEILKSGDILIFRIPKQRIAKTIDEVILEITNLYRQRIDLLEYENPLLFFIPLHLPKIGKEEG
jgi:very-short-patch-repair endonuclease